MTKSQQIIHEAQSLPVEERARVVDVLLRSLNAPDSEIDRKWAQVAKQRLAELRSGETKPVPGQDVFAEVHKRLSK